MVADKTGSLAGIKRHDYLPFGEELYAGTSGRTQAQGYAADSVRQKFTAYERDDETGLDYAQARYHSSKQGRFTSIDPLSASARLSDPQTLNRYSYSGNNPVVFSDPSGMERGYAGTAPMGSDGAANAALWAAGQGDIAEAEAEYEGRLNETVEEVNKAESISDGNEQAQGKAAADTNDNNIEAAAPQDTTKTYSDNSTMVVVWKPVKDSLNPSSAFGHVSYITMQNDQSYSWPRGITHPSDWGYASPSSAYTDSRSQDSAGRGYILDFGSKLNDKFQNAMLHAYDKTGGTSKHIYTIWNYNCGKAFNVAINAIRGDLRKQFGINLPESKGIKPSTIEAYVNNNLRQFIVAERAFEKH
jgi:RHS repeat-associated protein